MRVLVLGGTSQGRDLATALADAGIAVISSLAGRTRTPVLPSGEVRVGGFGGVDGLVDVLADAGIAAVVDATHPFAARMTEQAATACDRARVPLLVLRRPGWQARDGDRWQRVASAGEAAEVLASGTMTVPFGRSVLLTTGRSGAAAFSRDDVHRFVIRAIEPPDGPLPPRHTLLLDRGPFTVTGEREVFDRHVVGLVVTKDSGTDQTVAKLTVARERALPVLMIDRPPLPDGVPVVSEVEQALAWVSRRGSGA